MSPTAKDKYYRATAVVDTTIAALQQGGLQPYSTPSAPTVFPYYARTRTAPIGLFRRYDVLFGRQHSLCTTYI